MFWAVMVATSGFDALGEWSTPMPPGTQEPRKWRRQQCHGVTNRPSLREDLLPHGLGDLLRACWSVEPASRPPFTGVVAQLTAICEALHERIMTQ